MKHCRGQTNSPFSRERQEREEGVEDAGIRRGVSPFVGFRLVTVWPSLLERRCNQISLTCSLAHQECKNTRVSERRLEEIRETERKRGRLCHTDQMQKGNVLRNSVGEASLKQLTCTHIVIYTSQRQVILVEGCFQGKFRQMIHLFIVFSIQGYYYYYS